MATGMLPGMEMMAAVAAVQVARESLWPALQSLSQPAAATALTALWQGGAIALGLAMCLRLAPRTAASLRFGVWAAGFIVIIFLPFLPMLERYLSAGGSDAATTASAFSPPASSIHPIQMSWAWSIAITAVWLAASLYRAADLVIHSQRVRRLWKSAIPVGTAAGSNSLPSLPCRKPIEICNSEEIQRPSVIGFWAPRILIPEWLLVRLTPGELDQIVVHETEHLRRGDDWTNLLQKLALVLFPLNPALLWIERRLCLEREMACDEAVIRRTHAPRAYAACLTRIAERGLQHRAEALSLGAWQRRPELARRVHSILLRKPTLGPLATHSIVAVTVCSLIFGSLELSRCPQLFAFAPANEPAVSGIQRDAVISLSAEHRVKENSFDPAQLVSSHAMARPYLSQLKAEMPAHSQYPVDARGGVSPASPRLETANESSVAKLTQPSNPTPHAEMVKTEMLESASESESLTGQHWIVLTTWEQVQTAQQSVSDTSNASDTTGASETTAGSPQTGNETSSIPSRAPGQGPSQIAGQITITRLVLRILPAGSLNSSPAAVPIRNGWLVLQL
jgi:beta-lactamase regulating signal transducer with metallopeptidase domain